MVEILEMAKNAKKASKEINKLSTEAKNKVLLDMADKLENHKEEILEANGKDLESVSQGVLIDRLKLDEERIGLMAESLRQLASLKDFVGEVISQKTLKNGLEIVEKRVGFGVVGVIYESRPNVTSDVCGVCLKSSSSVVLKGGKEALNTNKVLVRLLSEAMHVKNSFQLVESSDRKDTESMLQLEEYFDLIIPRGGENLISFVRNNSRIPVIETGTGNCHIYVDEKVDVEQAVKIILNAKTQRPGVCNSTEKILVHKDSQALTRIVEELRRARVEVRGCERTRKLVDCEAASEEDWDKEYLDLVVTIKIVDNVDEAITHINKHGSKHSEAILSEDEENIEKFFDGVDSAVVYSNASTRFTDGCEFGLGTEIGISTQKMHARGPMGLKALTTTKYLVKGRGQVRT